MWCTCFDGARLAARRVVFFRLAGLLAALRRFFEEALRFRGAQRLGIGGMALFKRLAAPRRPAARLHALRRFFAERALLMFFRAAASCLRDPVQGLRDRRGRLRGDLTFARRARLAARIIFAVAAFCAADRRFFLGIDDMMPEVDSWVNVNPPRVDFDFSAAEAGALAEASIFA